MKHQHPVISCICITSNKPLMLQRAIACFRKQDYPNTELVLCYPQEDLLTRIIADRIEAMSIIKMIRIEHSEQEEPLFTKNIAINAATGSYICMWNEGHWYHESRISDQYTVLRKSPFKSSILMHVLIFDFKHQRTYCSRYANWQETLFCEKQLLLEASYIHIERAEENPVIHFLSSRNVLYHISHAPHLYIYIYNEIPEDTSTTAERIPYFSDNQPMDDINDTVKDIIDTGHYIFTTLDH